MNQTVDVVARSVNKLVCLDVVAGSGCQSQCESDCADVVARSVSQDCLRRHCCRIRDGRSLRS